MHSQLGGNQSCTMARSLAVTMPTETLIKYQDATMTSITLTPIGRVHSREPK